MKFKTNLNLGNQEPWISADTITQMFYHQDSEDEDWSYVLDVEGQGYMGATINFVLVLNESLVENQIGELAGDSNSHSLYLPIRKSPSGTCAYEVVATVTLNKAFLEEILADTMRELKVGSSDAS